MVAAQLVERCWCLFGGECCSVMELGAYGGAISCALFFFSFFLPPFWTFESLPSASMIFPGPFARHYGVLWMCFGMMGMIGIYRQCWGEFEGNRLKKRRKVVKKTLTCEET